jgi:hypothetical protein
MTQLPSPKKPSNNSSNYENLDAELKFRQPQEGQSSDWHQRMANLVGLEEEIPPSKEESSASETASSNASSNDEVPPSHPSSLRTQQRFSSNPFAKVAVVGAATLSGVLIAGIFLSQLMSGNNQQPRKIAPTITQNTNESNKTEQLKPEQEIEILKTKLALAEQAKAVKEAQLQLRTVRPPRATPTPTRTRSQPQPVTRVVVQRVPTPARTVYVPRVVERIVRVPQRVAQVRPTPTQPPQPPRATPTPQPTVTATPSATFELSSVPELAPIPMPSDVGEALSTNRSITPTPTPTPTVPQVASSPPAPLASEFNSRARQPLPNRTNTTTNPQQQSLASNQTKQYGGKAIAIGTKAKAVLAADIAGEANRPGTNNSSSSNNNNNNKDDSQFVVRLREPLKSVDGAIALPKNTELVAQVKQITEGGWVQLSVVSVNFQNNGNITEIRLPPDAIKIRRPGGRPLLARKYPDKSGKIAANDAFSGLLGGLGQVGDILNRPETKLRNCGTYGDNNTPYLCSETQQQRNIPAAVLEGASRAMVPQLNQRNQQATQEMMKSNIWHLEAGTEVEVYANKITKL